MSAAFEEPSKTRIEHKDGYVRVLVAGGIVGPEGPPNAGVAIVGVANSWPPTASPTKGDLWIIPELPPFGAPGWATSGHGAFWDGNQWLDAGLLRGTKGDRGEPGPPLNIKGTAVGWVPDANPKTGDVWILPDVLPAGVPAGFTPGGAAAWDGEKGVWVPLDAIHGPAGHDVEVFGPSATPPTTGVEKGDLWLSTDCSLFSPTFDPSTIVQVPGPAGPAGAVGQSAYDAWKISAGRPTAPVADFLAAITGAKGDKGDKGDAGETFKVEGVVPNVAGLPATPPRLTVYMVADTGHLYIYDPASASKGANDYVDLGKIAGPTGRAAWLSTPVDDVAKLPATGSVGEMVYVTGTGHLYGWDDVTAAWVDGGKIGGGIDDGTTQGQVLIWDAANGKWQPADSALPPAAHDGEVIVWDGTTTTWVARRPLLSELQDVDENSTNLTRDCVLVWDADVSQWTDSRSIGVDDIEFDASGPGTLMEGIAAQSDAGLDATKDTWVPSCMAVDRYLRDVIALEDLVDTKELAKATDGQVPVWNDANSRWEPGSSAASLNEMTDVTITTPANGESLVWDATASQWVNKPVTSPILFIGSGALNAANIADPAQNYGMAVDTVPSPASYSPAPGDQYLDLQTGLVTAFTGTITTVPRAGSITGVASPASRDLIPETLDKLLDVTLTSPSDGQLLRFNATTAQWENATPDFLNTTNGYTKVEVDGLVSAITTGLEHFEPVISRANTPPASPASGDLYIVNVAPSGAWAGQANKLALWNGSAWTFAAPKANETHLVQDVAETWHWNGTAWVQVAVASTTGGPAAAGELWMVGDVKQSILLEPAFINELPVAERNKWVLADGRTVTGSRYATITGNNNVPDLRGSFLRMSGNNAATGRTHWSGGAVGDFGEDGTARPKNHDFTGTTNTTGSHSHTFRLKRYFGAAAHDANNYNPGGNYDGTQETTNPNGDHQHTVTINGGGDTETRPKHFCLNFYIKIN